MRKALSEITREEWISFDWVEVPGAFDQEGRIFDADQRRTPNEACQAAMDWDSTVEEREQTKDIEL